jgi:radical SAM protein with 4Fe4S-binding SPASM domain
MNVNQLNLEQQLSPTVNILTMLDLGDLSKSPSALFKILDAHYREKYNHQDRIVFYTAHIPSEKFFQYLYEAVNFIDISNCFILICGPSELEQLINSYCGKYSTDPIPFQFFQTSIQDTCNIEDKFSLPDTICAIPWTNLEILQNGNITPCCRNSLVLGNIKDTTLTQAFHSELLQQLRNKLMDGQRPSACNGCWGLEEKNLTSMRVHNAKRLKKDFLTKYIDQPELSTLDIKFNNTCNFKCRICSSDSSSLFAQEQNKFLGKIVNSQNNWSEDQQFISQVVENLPSITNIDMFGGEPFLIKGFSKVLKLAVEGNHSSNIRLHYNSNGSIWPLHSLPYWPSFKMVDIHFSIDAIGKQFELQRGGCWEDVESNILRIKSLRLPNLTISIMPTISIMNVYYIDQVYDWSKKYGFPIFVNYVSGAGLELTYLTNESKKIISEKFKNHPWKEIQNILKIIQKLPDNDGEQFRSKIKWFDQVRQEKFAESHLEIAKAMRYV